MLGVAIALSAFRWFVPNDVFPVSYRRGKTAHLDITGQRAAAIATAVRDQLGLSGARDQASRARGFGGFDTAALRVRSDAAPDAAGSDEDGPAETTLFAKLYAKNHVRADRWYKVGRTILYGALEDETPFSTVRRFVEYEDYTLRLMEDLDLPVPRPYGVLEITPEREYMIVMEFFEGAVEIGEADIDEGVVDQGLVLIREMWDEGLAHRDVKPANLMVRDGELKVIDVFFVQVRPSPWRQAVDLANMMLVLGLRSDADTVYRHALKYFTPDEIAEAFAATRGVASPTQLRSMLKQDGRDLVERFRALAPTRQPVRIQRWSLRRDRAHGDGADLRPAVRGHRGAELGGAGMTGLVSSRARSRGGAWLATVLAIVAAGCTDGAQATPACSRPDSDVIVLQAQSVPTATRLPCVADLPVGWTFAGALARSDEASFWLDHDRAGIHAVEVTVRASCDTSAAVEVAPSPDELGMRTFREPTSVESDLHWPPFRGVRWRVHRVRILVQRRCRSHPGDRGRSGPLDRAPI